jgi:hypothetical protein
MIGGIVHFLLKRYQKRKALATVQVETADRHGLLFASGLITGEALIGILLAVPIVIFKRGDVLAIIKDPSTITEHISIAAGLLLLAIVTVWLFLVGRGKQAAAGLLLLAIVTVWLFLVGRGKQAA